MGREQSDRFEIMEAAGLFPINRRKNLSPEEVYWAIYYRINAEHKDFNQQTDPDLTRFIDNETHYELNRKGNFNYEYLSRLTEKEYCDVRRLVIKGVVARALEIFQGKKSPENPTPKFWDLCTTPEGSNLRCDLRNYIPREE